MLTIFMHGRRLDPAKAAERLLPSDTLLVCPGCNGRHVEAKDAKTTQRIGIEHDYTIPRLQDRYCLDCNHRWQTVLPPTLYAAAQPLIVPSAR